MSVGVSPGSRVRPVPARQPSMRPGWYWIFFRPCRRIWTRWAKLATARLASTPRLSTDQIPSTGLRLGAQVHVEVVPDQHDVPAGQLAVRGDEQVPVLDPAERLGLAFAAAIVVQPAGQPAPV